MTQALDVNVLQRLWILINGNDSIAMSNFSFSDGYFDFWDMIWGWLDMTTDSLVVFQIQKIKNKNDQFVGFRNIVSLYYHHSYKDTYILINPLAKVDQKSRENN